MQSQFLSISQELPLSNRLELAGSRVGAKKTVLDAEIAQLKTDIAAKIKALAYKIAAKKEELALLERFGSDIEQLGMLHGSLHTLGIRHQKMQLDSEIAHGANRLKILALQSEIERLKTSLAKESYINRPEPALTLTTPRLPEKTAYIQHALQNSPKIAKSQQEEQVAALAGRIAKEKETPDIKLSIGYFHRESFEDYLSFSIALPLQVYGREAGELARTKALEKAAFSQSEALKERLSEQVEQELISAKEAAKKIAQLKEMLRANKESMEIIEGQMQSGTISLREAIDVSKRGLDMERSIIKEKLALKLAHIELVRLGGGGL